MFLNKEFLSFVDVVDVDSVVYKGIGVGVNFFLFGGIVLNFFVFFYF